MTHQPPFRIRDEHHLADIIMLAYTRQRPVQAMRLEETVDMYLTLPLCEHLRPYKHAIVRILADRIYFYHSENQE